MNSTEIILYDSPEAASIQAPKPGWVSRRGMWWGDDENAARFDGCTHRACQHCGQPTEKSWLSCGTCRDKQDIERYNAREKMEWDGKAMLYSEETNDFYDSPGDALDATADGDEEIGLADLRLVICKPVYARALELDYWLDELADSDEAPEWLQAAIDEFNKSIKGREPLSWEPGRYALKTEAANG